KRLSAPPWVEVPCELSLSPPRGRPRYGKISSQSGGEGNGEWGLLGATRGTASQYPPCPETHLWDTMSPCTRGTTGESLGTLQVLIQQRLPPSSPPCARGNDLRGMTFPLSDEFFHILGGAGCPCRDDRGTPAQGDFQERADEESKTMKLNRYLMSSALVAAL